MREPLPPRSLKHAFLDLIERECGHWSAIGRPRPFNCGLRTCHQKLRFSSLHPMSCQLDDIGCIEDKGNLWRQIQNPQLKGRGLAIWSQNFGKNIFISFTAVTEECGMPTRSCTSFLMPFAVSIALITPDQISHLQIVPGLQTLSAQNATLIGCVPERFCEFG